VAGYHPYWAGDAWQSYPFDLIDELYFFEMEADSEGSLSDPHGWPTAWSAMVDRARSAGVQVVPTVSMHDPAAFETVFTDPLRSGRLADEALALVADRPTVSGLHLDVEVFEPVSLDARDGFTAFVVLLRDRMRVEAPGSTLSVFLLAFDDDDVYNERALGQIADFVVVQGYDYHSAGSPNAGPVGATTGWGRLNWDTVLARLDGFGVPREKVVMGVPLYGYEWPVESEEAGSATRGPGRTIPLTAPPAVLPGEPRALQRVAEHGARRDPVSGVPWYTFRDADGWWQGWFEDAESLRAKYDFVRRHGLGGIAIFPLAYGSEEVWSGVRRAMR
jgi:spore germination protein YaaH